jgi:hypothetical protein
MHQRPGERLLFNEIRQHRLGEQPDRGNHDIELKLPAVFRRQLPGLVVGHPPGRRDLGRQL